jgi:CRISPR-associated protein Cst1
VERIQLNPEKPLFTYEEFAKELFPDGSFRFGDTRYLILFRLYEQLHDWLKQQDGIGENEDAIKEIEDKADVEDSVEE